MAAKRHGSAGRGLRRAIVVAFVVVAAALAGPAEGKEKPASKVTPQLLDALARQYRDAGLPLPPPDAPPTWLPSGTWETAPGGTLPRCVIGFEVAPGDGGTGSKFLVGTEEIEVTLVPQQFHLPRRLKPNQGLPTDYQPQDEPQVASEKYPLNRWLIIAVQCHLRGYDRLAEQILARGLAHDVPAPQRLAPTEDGNPRDALAATAWNYWMNALLAAGADRPAVLARLEKMAADFPVLDGAFQRDYLASLRQSLVPSRAAPDSVEAKIDALVDYAENNGPGHGDNGNPDYEGLMTLGFAAVPAYIAHLDDRRLTRALTLRDDGGPIRPRLVGDVVSDLIEDLAGLEAFPTFSYNRPPGQPADRQAVERWWAKARATGEEEYMTRTVFPPNVVSAQFLAERYPQRMEEAYLRLLAEKPEADCWVLEAAISGMAPDVQRRLFRLGAACANLSRSMEAIGRLREIDRSGADGLLIEKFNHWPTDAGRYAGQPVEASASIYVSSSESAEVWQAYERALFRAVPALRMELLGRLAEFQLGGAEDVRRLAVFDLFLDDPEVRVIRREDEEAGGKFEGYAVTPENRRLRVGDHAAELLAQLLNVQPPAGTARTERWWAKYRETVRAAIDQHAREGLQTPIEDP